MEAHGCRHKIRFLAPSGSAAALIDGMTVHKGLGIKVQKKDKGKGNRTPGEGEDYNVIFNITSAKRGKGCRTSPGLTFRPICHNRCIRHKPCKIFTWHCRQP